MPGAAGRSQGSGATDAGLLGVFDRGEAAAGDYRESVGRGKGDLWRAYESDAAIREAIDETLRSLNGTKGDAASFDRLDGLLSAQAYRLAYWRNAGEEVNYRRFFGLNELVAVRIEDPEVFTARHARTIEWVQQGKWMDCALTTLMGCAIRWNTCNGCSGSGRLSRS